MPPLNTTVIAIDGLAGSGKSTTAEEVAKTLKWNMLDTGSLYRAVAYLALEREFDLDDAHECGQLARQMASSIEVPKPRSIAVFGRDLSGEIRTAEAGAGASRVGVHRSVRNALLPFQHQFGSQKPGCVAEGRDTGTTVFPDAILKIHLEARESVRAARLGRVLDKDVVDELQERDRRDSTRAISPLVKAHDAVIINTTKKSTLEVAQEILSRRRKILFHIRQRKLTA